MNKRNIAMILLISAGVIFIITIFLLIMGKNKVETKTSLTEPTENTNQSNDNKITTGDGLQIDNLDGLYFYTSASHLALKENIAGYLTKNGYTDVKVLDIVGTPKSEDDITFTYWLYASVHNIVLRGQYNMDTDETTFFIENDQKVLDNLPGITLPLQDGDHSDIEDKIRNPEISNINELKGIMDDKEISTLINELNDFLVKRNEHRRSFTITNIINSKDLISFDCLFVVHGLNDYDINVIFNRSEKNSGSCNFTVINMVNTQEHTNE